jgi:cytochrome c oxidase cbb3-type subunit 3
MVRFLLKAVAAFIVLLIVFGYGVAVGRYELFPFGMIQQGQTAIGQVFAPGNASRGQELFENLCARCHGSDGSGGDGPALNRPHLKRAGDDESLRLIITQGIENAGMPPVRQTTVAEQNDIIAYVRRLGRRGPAALRGNVERGKKIYDDSGCASCHILDGQGASFGPELTDIGLTRGPEYLRTALTQPDASLPKGISPLSRGFTEFLPVRVVTRDGSEIRGMRINEDTFTIQLRDAKNQLYSFEKAELRELEKKQAGSFMPSFKEELTPDQLDDLIAYLSAHRDAQ